MPVRLKLATLESLFPEHAAVWRDVRRELEVFLSAAPAADHGLYRELVASQAGPSDRQREAMNRIKRTIQTNGPLTTTELAKRAGLSRWTVATLAPFAGLSRPDTKRNTKWELHLGGDNNGE